MADMVDPDALAHSMFLLTIVGAALFIGSVFLFIL